MWPMGLLLKFYVIEWIMHVYSGFNLYWISVKMKNVLYRYLFVQDSYFCSRMAAGFVLDVVDNVMTGQVRWR